jgi:hypothetical protein
MAYNGWRIVNNAPYDKLSWLSGSSVPAILCASLSLKNADVRLSDVYVLDGITDRGRRLRLVFQDKGNRLARVFTGWDLKRKKKRKR